LTAPRAERRLRLRTGWEFECLCQRCSLGDDCRAFRCGGGEGGCDGLVFCIEELESGKEKWQCRLCGGDVGVGGWGGMAPEVQVVTKIEIASKIEVERSLIARLEMLQEEALQVCVCVCVCVYVCLYVCLYVWV